MDLVKYIFYMGVIHIVFSTGWKFVATFLSSMLESIGLHKDWSFLAFKAMGYYLVVSISALVTWDMMKQGTALTAALVGLVGLFIIYTTVAGNLERNRWRAVMNYERKRVRVMRFDGYLLIGSVLLFLVTLALPEIAAHPLNNGIRAIIDGVYHTPVIGWMVGFAALFYMMHIIAKGIRATDYLVQLLLHPGKVRANPPKRDGNWGSGNDQLIEDAEFVDVTDQEDAGR